MRKLMLAALAALHVGCAMRVVRDDSPVAGEVKTYALNSFLWAFIPGKNLPPADELCPGGRVQTLDLGMEPSQVLITAVTIGTFVPYKVAVTCKN